MERILFTSESVSEGHPDKICDQISDAILDAVLEQDKYGRVACETFATAFKIIVSGEITTTAVVDYEQIVRDTIKDIGYTKETMLDPDNVPVEIIINHQSPEIWMGVSKSQDEEEIGAGDQGIMFGYATNETITFLPLPISIAHDLVRYASELRRIGKFKYSRPDMKSQVTIDYTFEEPKVKTIVMSVQHDENINIKTFKAYIEKKIIANILNSYSIKLADDFELFINPTGKFVIGGPVGDTGLTGRKIIIDTYGGVGRHGGGCFSGKDPTKVDRTSAYAARHIAKNIVAAGIADKAEIQLSYAIGISEPISIYLETFGTEKIEHEKITNAIRDLFDLRPGAIIKRMKLRRPIYKQTAAYGHFGRNDIEFPWEKLDYVDKFKKYLNFE